MRAPWRQVAEQGRQREHREPNEGSAPAAIAIGKRTRRRQQGGKGEDIGADHPFDVGESGTEITRDRWQDTATMLESSMIMKHMPDAQSGMDRARDRLRRCGILPHCGNLRTQCQNGCLVAGS
jgi:hypothetical protein